MKRQRAFSVALIIGALVTAGGTVDFGVKEAAAWGIFPPAGGNPPQSCTYFVPDLNVTGDLWYGDGFHPVGDGTFIDTLHIWNWCTDGWLANVASGYGMQEQFWDNGFGWTDACNPTKPFGRLAAARLALEVSSPTPQFTGTIPDGNVVPLLHWALLWSYRAVRDLRGDCGIGSPFAAVTSGDTIRLNILGNRSSAGGFFYGNWGVVNRAASLLHEAAHANGAPGHVTNGTQDLNWGMNPAGAYQWTVVWLWQYCRQGVNQPVGMACKACDLAQAYLDSSFCAPDATGACTNNTGITVVDRANTADPCYGVPLP